MRCLAQRQLIVVHGSDFTSGIDDGLRGGFRVSGEA
jgi:hypothetical protein